MRFSNTVAAAALAGAALALAVGQSAAAQAIAGGFNQQNSGPVSASGSFSSYIYDEHFGDQSGSASSAADIAAGTLSAQATNGDVALPLFDGALAYAQLLDDLSFTVAGADGDTVTRVMFEFTYQSSASWSGDGPLRGNVGLAVNIAPLAGLGGPASLDVSSDILTLTESWTSAGWSNAPTDWYLGAETGLFAYDLLGAASTLSLSMDLTAIAFETDLYNGGQTLGEASVKLIVPHNVTVTSRSGAFAVTVAPEGPSAAPEPSAWALMILGFGSAGAMLRSRRRQAA